MDIGTGLAIFGSRDLIVKLLGPTADYLGEGIRDWVERRKANIGNILGRAKEILGDRLDEPGTVPPRVLKEILNEGSFCEDPLLIEYFGGVLASSRSGIVRDDRGATWAALVARLSSYQVRTHFLVYRAIYDRHFGQDFIFNAPNSDRWRIFVAVHEYLNSMELQGEEIPQREVLLHHSFWGLEKERLIKGWTAMPTKDLEARLLKEFHSLPKKVEKLALPGPEVISIVPTEFGTELFLWAHGHGNRLSYELLKLSLELPENFRPINRVFGVEDMLGINKKSQGNPSEEPAQ